MLRFKLSKFKQVCSSILLPRILLKNLKYSKELNYNRTLEQFSKVRKSTNSSNENEASDKQMHIIEKCFAEKDLEPEARQLYKEVKEVDNDILTPEFYNLKRCDRCDTLISKLFKNDTSVDKNECRLENAKLQATTAKQDEEKLAQKIEIVDETPHVEAHPPKNEGFNSMPNILGTKATCEMSKSQNTYDERNLDDLAQRCLGSPVSDIDKTVIEELKRISQNNTQPNMDIDLVRNQYVENDINENNNEAYVSNFESLNKMDANACRFERIQPVHLDTVPLLFINEAARDYKESGLIREYSTLFFTTDVDETSIDTPPPLSPYEKPALPFYEYPNKENITPEDDSKMETAAVDEDLQENEIIFKEDSLQRNALDQEGSPILEGGDNLSPKPNISQCNESILESQLLTRAEDKVYFKSTYLQDATLNIFNSQHFFTSEADTSDMHDPHKEEPQSSSISSTFLPEGEGRTLDIPANTSISANQNPDEYYNISIPEEYLTEDQTVTRIFAESPVAQNIFFSGLPQIELEEAAERAETIPHTVSEPEAQHDDSLTKEASVESNLDEIASKRDVSCSETTVPLSLLLKHIRERNRLEYCRNIVAKAHIKLDGNEKFTCPPPPCPKIKPKNETVKPCQPKPKPANEPCKIKPCPSKKDPCAKLIPIFLSTAINHANTSHNAEIAMTSLSLISGVLLRRIQELGEKLKFSTNNGNCGDVIYYARDFQPWIPIPSWPIPKKVKKRPFVCPKEGCKVPLPQPNKPCKEKQCLGLSKQTFSGFFAS